MPKGSSAAGAVTESASPETSAEEMAEALIAAHDGLKDENRVLRGAASPGFVRRRPLVFGASS
jgi:hypothetical protein